MFDAVFLSRRRREKYRDLPVIFLFAVVDTNKLAALLFAVDLYRHFLLFAVQVAENKLKGAILSIFMIDRIIHVFNHWILVNTLFVLLSI